MAGNDYKLKFVIDADGTTAKQALGALTADVNNLGGRFSSTFGGMVPIAGAAAGAILGIAAGAATVGRTLFDITKTAAEFGSTIYDASQKTGLGATALSALKASAEQSGSSLEAVTKGVAKFAKQYEGTSSDLQAELGKVFKQINDAKPGFEQLTLAQKNFGKAGAELIPMIRSTDGDLDGMIKRMKELGITIDDDGAAKADAFGDQMDVLSAQIAGVGRTIGTALMPQFTSMATQISNWIVQNQDQVANFAQTTATLFGNFIRGLNAVKDWLSRNGDTLRTAAALLTGGSSEMLISGAGSFWKEITAPRAGGPSEASGGFRAGSYDPGTLTGGGGGKKIRPPKESDGEFRRFFTDLGFGIVRTFGKAINEGSPHTYGGAADISIKGKSANDIFTLMVKALEKGYRVFDERIPAPGVKQTGPHLHFENAKTTLQKESRFTGFKGDELAYLKKLDAERLGKATGKAGLTSFIQKNTEDAKRAEDDFFDYAEQVLQDWINAEKQASNERLDIRSEENNLAEEMLRSQLEQGLITETEYIDRISTLKINALEDEKDELAAQIGTRENNHKIAVLDLKIATEKLKKENDIADALERQNEEYREMIGALKKVNPRPYGMAKRGKKDGGIWGSMLGGMQDATGKMGELDDATGKIRGFETVIQGLGQTASDVFMQMGAGLGAMLQSWVLLGDQADVSMSKMVASVLAGVAAQAATLAIFHLAMGIVALTPWGAAMYGPPTNHFIAAAIWGGIAAGAAVGGRALAGNKFQSGGGKGSTTSSNRSSDSESLTPYSRASERAYHSGTQQDPVRRLATAVERLDKKIGSMKPGDVLTAGARQRPGFFATQTGNDIARNSALGSKIARNIGIR